VASLTSAEMEQSSVSIEKIKKLSRVVMAVSALEKACLHRKQNINGLNDNQKKSLLNYTGKNFFGENMNVPNSFDNYEERFRYAMRQLDVVERYL
jgi:hypothetical protein